RIIAVQIQSANSVFIVSAVPVIVYAFGINKPFALAFQYPLHQLAGGIARINNIVGFVEFVGFGLPAHLIDNAVTVQIFFRIFIVQAVIVIVVRPYLAAVALGSMHIHIDPIRVVDRAQVNGLGIQ